MLLTSAAMTLAFSIVNLVRALGTSGESRAWLMSFSALGLVGFLLLSGVLVAYAALGVRVALRELALRAAAAILFFVMLFWVMSSYAGWNWW